MSNNSSKHFNLRLPLAFTDALRAGTGGANITRVVDSTLRRYAWLVEQRKAAIKERFEAFNPKILEGLRQDLSYIDTRSSSLEVVLSHFSRKATAFGIFNDLDELDLIALLELAEASCDWSKLAPQAVDGLADIGSPLTAHS